MSETWPEERADAIGQNGNGLESWDGREVGNPWLAKHGHRPKETASPTYSSWLSMKSRCADLENINYGGKGVRVCSRWESSFQEFLRDMGERPYGCTIDRIDSEGDYEPGNCRWSSSKEQAANRSNNIYVEIDGDILLITEAAKAFGVAVSTICRRYSEGLRDRELVDNRNRNYLRTGEKCSSAKLKEKDVITIKSLLRSGDKVTQIANIYRVSSATISDIKAGRTWRDVE